MIGINGNDGLHYDQTETKLGDQITTVCKRNLRTRRLFHTKASHTQGQPIAVSI